MRTIGPYTILEELGRGGQGVVYLAEDTRLNRKVALKVIETTGQDMPTDRLERFRREAEAASSLDHPNICGIHEAGEADGAHYIAMRYVEGKTLAEQIETARDEHGSDTDSTPSSREQIHAVLHRIEKIARALHVAHEQGLIHRDIKPGNIMLTAGDEPVVLDFGLARDEFGGDDLSLTQSGDLLGTPAYMSPEQLMAQRIPLDRRTDIYSLGATLYESLTLKRPFEALTRAELYQRIMTHEPSSATSINRAIPADLRVVLETALEKDRDRRYQTALDFAEDLRRVRQFEPIQAKPIGRLLRLRRWAQRNPAAAVGVLGFFFAFVVTLGFLEQMRRDLRHTRAIALVGAAGEVLRSDPSLSLLLAHEAVRLEQSAKTLSALHGALARHHELAEFRYGEDEKTIASDISRAGQVLTVADRLVRIWSPDGQLLRSLPHETEVSCGVFSADGQTIATGCEDGLVSLWSIDGRRLAEDPGHKKRVLSVAFAPEGEPAVLTASKDGSARLWNLADASKVSFKHESKYKGSVSIAIFSPDGEHVLTNYKSPARREKQSPMAFLWSRSGERRASLRGHTNWVLSAAFSKLGNHIATSSLDGTARLWDLKGDLLSSMPHPARVASVSFQAREDGFRILTGCIDGKVRIWDREGRLRDVIPGLSLVSIVTASRSGDRILTAGGDQMARLFDADGELLSVFAGHKNNVKFARFSPDETEILTGSVDGSVRLWDAKDKSLPVLRGHAGGVSSAVFSRDQQRILTSSVDGTVRLWSADGDRIIREFRGHHDWVNSVAFSPDKDEQFVVSASDDGTVRLWKTADGTLLHTLGDGKWGFNDAAISPAGDLVAASTNKAGKRVMLWDVKTGENKGTLEDPESLGSRFLGFSLPNGTQLATSDINHDVLIWDVARGEVDHRLSGHAAMLSTALFSPVDGLLVASASADNTARIWDLRTGDFVVCAGHQGGVVRCEFSPDGTMLATGSKDGTARIWDLAGRELAVLRRHTGAVWDVSFSPDGGRLLTASLDNTVRTWIVDPAELLKVVTQRLDLLDRDFTPEELERFGDLLGR